jgi:hypothetical protein
MSDFRCFPREAQPAVQEVIERLTKNAQWGKIGNAQELLTDYARTWRDVKIRKGDTWYRDAKKEEVLPEDWEPNPTSPTRVFLYDRIEASSSRSSKNFYYQGPVFRHSMAQSVLRMHFTEMISDFCTYMSRSHIGDKPFESPDELEDFLGTKGPGKKGAGADVIWAVLTVIMEEWANLSLYRGKVKGYTASFWEPPDRDE